VTHQGKVVEAIIDNKWDELKQRGISDFERIKLNDSSNIPLYYCPDPRPANCIDEQSQVCSSAKSDYINGCEACKDPNVKWFLRDKCNSGYYNKVADDLNKGKITKDSGPVLVLYGMTLN